MANTNYFVSKIQNPYDGTQNGRDLNRSFSQEKEDNGHLKQQIRSHLIGIKRIPSELVEELIRNLEALNLLKSDTLFINHKADQKVEEVNKREHKVTAEEQKQHEHATDQFAKDLGKMLTTNFVAIQGVWTAQVIFANLMRQLGLTPNQNFIQHQDTALRSSSR